MDHKYDAELCLKIISCHGKVNARSTAKMCNTSAKKVYSVWHSNNLEVINKNKGKYGYEIK